jgi:septum formation protein
VLAADTVVVLEDRVLSGGAAAALHHLAESGDTVLHRSADTGETVLGKPRTAEEAAEMLRLLSGRSHAVLTGVCVLDPRSGRRHSEVVRTVVRFAPLDEAEIAGYVATGEPMDKAGAYAIQGRASRFVESIEGCYFNVVGLPVSTVYRILKQLRDAR